MKPQVVLHLNVTGTDKIKEFKKDKKKGEGVVEFIATKLNDNKVVDHFKSLLNPQRPISQKATKWHGYSNNQKEIKQAKTFADIALPFIRFVEGHELILRDYFFHEIVNQELIRLKLKKKDAVEMFQDTSQEKRHLKKICSGVTYTRDMFKKLHSNSSKEDQELDSIVRHYDIKDAKCENDKMVKVVQKMNDEKSKLYMHIDEKHVLSKNGMYAKPQSKPEPIVPINERMGLFQLGL